ncbi:MAG: cobalamin-binding domain-containing protein [Dehalococcoidia bacterium]
MKTIRYYIESVASPRDVFVGGILATLLGDELEEATGVHVVGGLLDRPGMLDPGDRLRIDELMPDYDILNEVEYKYGLQDSYFGYATRGCPNRCEFCAVRKIEPNFVHYLPMKKQMMGIDEVYGPKCHLTLMDNNVLASDDFERIVNDILDLGFHKGATFGPTRKQRTVDFNQGVDARYLTRGKMALLAKLAIKPLRIAFDHIEMKDMYVSKIQLAREHGFKYLSNYVLYNYLDTPDDFYERLRINVALNESLGTQIYSFPMKFIPLDAKDRFYVGKHWNRKLLRGVQCILLATKGLVGLHQDFFDAAFGSSPEEFIRIVLMPEEYIIYRRRHSLNGALDWQLTYDKLTKRERSSFLSIVSDNRVREQDISRVSSTKIRNLLSHYIETPRQSPIS